MQNLSPRAAWLYLMRLDDLWASLFRASLPPAPGLTASSCSYGREFASRFFQLRLAATPCGSLRLPSSAPVGSFHPTRFRPCWAHSAADCQSASSPGRHLPLCSPLPSPLPPPSSPSSAAPSSVCRRLPPPRPHRIRHLLPPGRCSHRPPLRPPLAGLGRPHPRRAPHRNRAAHPDLRARALPSAWEATLRFHAISTWTACAILLLFTVFPAWRSRGATPAASPPVDQPSPHLGDRKRLAVGGPEAGQPVEAVGLGQHVVPALNRGRGRSPTRGHRRRARRCRHTCPRGSSWRDCRHLGHHGWGSTRTGSWPRPPSASW